MIEGIGTDIIEVERVKAKIEKEQGFRELVFSPQEITYCESRTKKYEHFAARFAAKEAFLKALGSGWVSGTAFNEIEIVPNEEGKPELRLSGVTKQTFESKKLGKISVTVSHVSTLATATVIIEK